jgi:hypothetical protein
MTNAIDYSIDFDALLLEAQKKYKEYTEYVDQYRTFYVIDVHEGPKGFPKDIQRKIDSAYRAWTDWCKENVDSRGLHLCTNMLGIPTGISAVLAGRA